MEKMEEPGVPEIEGLLTNSYVRACIYGDPGVGKTPFIGTGEDTLILDADNGSVSAGILGSSAKRMRVRDWDDMEEAKDYLRHKGSQEFKWAWLDSATLWQDRGLDHIMQVLVAGKEHRKIWAPDKGEYGQNMNRLMIWIREFVDLPMNVGVTAHVLRTEVEEVDEDGDINYRTLYMPHIQGKNMPSKVCGEMNVVGYMYAKEVDGETRRYLRVRGDEYHYCKDRFGSIGNDKGIMANPSIPKIEAKIAGQLPGRQRPPAKAAKKAAPVKKTSKRASVVRKSTVAKKTTRR